jgi:hypothetical protein
MVECPVCGKWLKHVFALNGHIRLKGDDLHHAYFEAHNKQIPKKNITDIENQFEEFKSSFEGLGDYLVKLHEEILSMLNKIEDITLRLSKVEQFVQSNMHSSKSIIQQEAKTEIPEIKREKTQIFAELIKQYGSFENVLKYVDHWILLDAINKDPNLNLSQKLEYKDIVSKKWLRN